MASMTRSQAWRRSARWFITRSGICGPVFTGWPNPACLLRVGPYQGTLGCLEIAFGSGVCGTAAVERRTVIVADVNLFPGHIACDARARSEIVVPVTDSHGALLGVLDINAESPGAFGPRDAEGLEQIVKWFARTTDAS